MVDIFELDELRASQPMFETQTQARVFADFHGPLFRGDELGNFELLPAFPAANAGVPLPGPVRDALKWKRSKDVFPGAYPPGK